MTSTISTAKRTDAPTGVLATLRATPVQVRYLLGGVLVNQMGAFVQTFLVLYLTAREFSLGQAGFALTAYSAGAVLGTILGGELTQRFGPRATIVGAMSTSAVILALVPTLSGPGRFGLLLAAIALAGLATQSYRPAAAVLLSDLIPDEHRVMGFSMMRIAMNGGAALSPLIAAGLILVDWDLLFYLDAATALGYALLALTLLPKVAAPREEEEVETADEPGVRGGAYALLFRDGRYLAFLVSVLFGALIYVQYTVALPLKITEEGHPAALYSGVLTASSVILILCELKITSYVKNWKPYVAGAGGTALMGIGVAGYGLPFGSSVTIVACTVLFVLGVMTSGPTMFAHPATYPAAVKARYIAAHQAVFGLGMALGPTLGVLAWSTLGNGIWAICGVLGVIAGLCARVGLRGHLAA
ncbi:MFS transporter [Kitasatospora sp. NBC_00070]|uniref:MFS transporter n=1 Tax=Kitasatospora sp. NBC_00070 TaxID=2975962 RepID=UPI003248FFAF